MGFSGGGGSGGGGGGAVSSVFGRTGAVTAQPGDYTIAQITGAVTSVFGRTGAVVAAANDYTIAQITNAVTSVFGRNGAVVAATNDYTIAQIANAVLSVFGRIGAVVADTADYTNAQVTNSAPLIESVNVVAASGAAQAIPDVSTDTLNLITLTTNCTFTFPAAAAGKSLLIALIQDGTGSRTATWPATVKWPGGITPTLTTTAGKLDMFGFTCLDGANWEAVIASENS